MSDTVFRQAPQKSDSAPQPLSRGDSTTIGSVTNVEVPYLDYEAQKSHPFSVDHYELGDRWRDPTGGFPSEVSEIENYFREKITSGEVANSLSAVKARLKEIEKVTNVSKEERRVIKLSTIAAYIKFLKETDNIKRSITRYGNT